MAEHLFSLAQVCFKDKQIQYVIGLVRTHDLNI